jgi:hypothetical protein
VKQDRPPNTTLIFYLKETKNLSISSMKYKIRINSAMQTEAYQGVVLG